MLKIGIKPQEKRTKKEAKKKGLSNKSKTINKMAIRTNIDNYLKCKWIK